MSTAVDDKDIRAAEADKDEKSGAAQPSAPDTERRAPLTIAVRLSTVVTTALIVALLAVGIVFGCLYFSARSTLSDRDAAAAGDKHAEDIASKYAVGASTIDYHDVKSWIERLKAGTTTQLAAKFDATAPQLEQILLPLQWTSKATPLSAAVTSESDGIYKVNAYLDVTSTSAQTPDGGRTTVTYSLTIDRNADWKITDVGGLQNALPTK
jgi:Mce-associated membrane protein